MTENHASETVDQPTGASSQSGEHTDAEPSIVREIPGDEVIRIKRLKEGYEFTARCIEECRMKKWWNATPELEEQLAALMKRWWDDPDGKEVCNQEVLHHQLAVIAIHCMERLMQLSFACFLMRRKPVRECREITNAKFVVNQIGLILGNEVLHSMIPAAEEDLRTVLDDYWLSTPLRKYVADNAAAYQPADTSDVVERFDREGYSYAASIFRDCRLDPDWKATPGSEEKLTALVRAWYNAAEVADGYKFAGHELEVLARCCWAEILTMRFDSVFLGMGGGRWDRGMRRCANMCLYGIASIIGEKALDAVIAKVEEEMRKKIGDEWWRVYTGEATEEEKARVYDEIERKSRGEG
jgi:hypothetical protein